MGRIAALLLLALLLAGCGNAAAPASQSSAPPAPSSREEPRKLTPAEAGLPDGYWKTLYAVDPESGEARVVREGEIWMGWDLEDQSPSGNRLLLSMSLGGSKGRVSAFLTFYDLAEDRLVNLTPPDQVDAGGYDGTGKYQFLDEKTVVYTELLDPGEVPGSGMARYYDIGPDGGFTPRTVVLEGPAPAEKEEYGPYGNPDSLFLYLPESKAFLLRLYTDQGWEWLAFQERDGTLLDRSPAENAPRGWWTGQLVDGTIYKVEHRWEDREFDLLAYRIAADETETLVTAPIPPGEFGWQSDVYLEGVRDGAFLLQCWPGNGYYETVWDPALGGAVDFSGEELLMPGDLPGDFTDPHLLTTLPTGELLILAG